MTRAGDERTPRVGSRGYREGMIDRQQVLRYRMHAQQLDRQRGDLADTAVLDLGAQDTGPDGALWALAIRGVTELANDEALVDGEVANGGAAEHREALVWFWTLRGAPHCYRRSDAGQVAAAVAPWSEADAAKRIFDASKPLKDAAIPVLDALDAVAAQMRTIVKQPMVKGELSTRLHEVMPEPYQRYCRSCEAVHLYEMPFRLSAVQAGLELVPDTSPPVLEPMTGFTVADAYEDRLDPVRAYLRPVRSGHREAGRRICGRVRQGGQGPLARRRGRDRGRRGRRAGCSRATSRPCSGAEASGTRLLGPYDLFLQARDRSTIVQDPEQVKTLWPVLGRPGAVLIDGEIAGLWRPRKSGKQFTVAVEPWRGLDGAARKAVESEAERLAAFRGIALTAVTFAD